MKAFSKRIFRILCLCLFAALVAVMLAKFDWSGRTTASLAGQELQGAGVFIGSDFPAITRSYPRILSRGNPGFSNIGNADPVLIENMQSLLCAGQKQNSIGHPLKNRVVCSVVFPGESAEEHWNQYVSELQNTETIPCTASNNLSNTWQIALLLDQVAAHVSPGQLKPVFDKLAASLEQCLGVLDGRSASLWHGRFSLGLEAFITALVLPVGEQTQKLKTRAYKHFLNSIEAIRLTEGWPSGYNYWINSRALTFLIAVDGFLNSVSGMEGLKRELVRIVRRVGLWHIYMTRPDNRIAAIADDGPRVDLKHQTRLVMEYIAKLTGESLYADYAEKIVALHGVQADYADFYWLLPFTSYNFNSYNDTRFGERTLRSAAGGLELQPLSDVFGSGAYNQVVIRSGWNHDATFLQFRAGSLFSHHQHYDAGHFSLFKRMPVFVDSSIYFGMQTDNRLYYSVRTVAKNGLLIHRSGEDVRPSRAFEESVAAGGQRLVFPTGSAITSVAHWRENQETGWHLKAGHLISKSDQAGVQRYQLDLTAAYDSIMFDSQGSGGKVRKVLRDISYLKGQDIVIIRDRVWPVESEYRVTAVFHTLAKPMSEIVAPHGLTMKIRGDGGVLARVDYWSNVALSLDLIGGEKGRYWVVDDNTMEGKNYDGGSKQKSWFDNPEWRTELSGYPAASGSFELLTVVQLHAPEIASRPDFRVKPEGPEIQVGDYSFRFEQ
ncbi:hypothetical protein [Oleiphilus messinensis]|nr:hypothetical protein [Oleiphilus messinensis]